MENGAFSCAHARSNHHFWKRSWKLWSCYNKMCSRPLQRKREVRLDLRRRTAHSRRLHGRHSKLWNLRNPVVMNRQKKSKNNKNNTKLTKKRYQKIFNCLATFSCTLEFKYCLPRTISVTVSSLF